MAITIHPRPGQILFCDFSKGFKKPEMVKEGRPVIILTGAIKGRSGLVTIAPLSTVEPNPTQLYHYKLPKQSLPMLDFFQRSDSWIKGDMLYTVGFQRLNLIRLGTKTPEGKRKYFTNALSKDQMKIIYECILHGLNLGKLSQYL
ncbi:MAG: type II toxin-antitoxin system PemK/MazF family toxin [Gammaproteobacteria bacterium]|nr:type II toxin-antitoxin system PemK/MazF family toxin [Gammaproteobacteria bacterium]